MREPFDLRAPLPRDHQDRQLIELVRDRRLPAQIMKQVEQQLPEPGAADHRVIGPAKADAGDLYDLLAERSLLLVALLKRQLRKTRRLVGHFSSGDFCWPGN